ncbi:unnamed protein product [Cuscuta europaea]|uniref:Uncharacterized protein n=1 Tax=Cuscuta europaea TaxID=41803 RepID=A0A9P0ZPI1_CUSEU|nr:unnamed protein product [Cuscuta europaea]
MFCVYDGGGGDVKLNYCIYLHRQEEMKCFMPCIVEIKEESRAVKSNLAIPSPSAFLDEHDLASTSLNASDSTTSTESSRSRTTQFPNSSKRSSDLGQFTFSELKEATKKFSR